MKFLFFNQTEQMIAFRYIKSRRVEGFISISAWFSLIGIMLGVATLIVVMSVMNGFRTELVDRILGINGHLVVYEKNELYVSNYNEIIFFRGPTDLGPVKVIEGVRSLLEKCIIVRGKDKFSIFLVKTQGTVLGFSHLTIFFFIIISR